jgi:hypothetical protein
LILATAGQAIGRLPVEGPVKGAFGFERKGNACCVEARDQVLVKREGARLENVRVEITEVGPDETRREVTLPHGRTGFLGKTVRAWLDQLGGPQGQLDSPAGKVDVDLTQWLDRDLDATVLRIRVSFVDPKKIGTRPGSRRGRDSSG